MLLRRFYDESLAQATYLIGCEEAGVALVVDPNRDVQAMLDAAAADRLRITHVTETHIHADFVSGSLELATRADATLLLSDEGDASWKYAFAGRVGATLLRDGDQFNVGRVRVDVMHVPGHTPEHLAFLITDGATSERPMGICTGDFVFVGDVGRPDLLERAAHVAGTMETSARALYGSLQRFRALPPWLQVWPGHGAGSACGKSLGAVPQSTVGYELLGNWAFQVRDEDEFVRQVLEGQPEPPRYFAEMKRINRDGPPLRGAAREPPHVHGERLAPVLDAGGLVVDARAAADFARAHVPGTLNIPLNKSFSTWAGSLVPYDREFYLLVSDAGALTIALHDLALIGLDRVAGVFGEDALDAWRAAGRPVGAVAQISADELRRGLETGVLAAIDVRGHAEWKEGHLPGVPNIPLGDLADRASEAGNGTPVVVHCQGGSRSAIAASVLLRAGVPHVINAPGGFAEWERLGYPVLRSE